MNQPFLHFFLKCLRITGNRERHAVADRFLVELGNGSRQQEVALLRSGLMRLVVTSCFVFGQDLDELGNFGVIHARLSLLSVRLVMQLPF